MKTKITKADELKTFDFGSLEGQKQTKEHNAQIHNNIINNPDGKMHKEGESFNEATNRVVPKMKDILDNAPANTTVVTHNSVYGLIKLWDKENRPDNFDKDQREKYTKQDNKFETGEHFTIQGKNGPIHIARHGETKDNVEKNFRTPNTELTKKGISQARGLGKALGKHEIPEIITSPLPRAMHTSDVIMKHQSPKKNLRSGGWLDNYGEEENANEGKIVAGPDSNQGTTDKGFNYNGAWGGQFQKGGKVPKYVASKNDPRYKAYMDSLTHYNQGKIDERTLMANARKMNLDESKFFKFPNDFGYDKIKPTHMIGVVNPGGGFYRDKNGAPVSFTYYRDKKGNDIKINDDTSMGKALNKKVSLYKYPKQPIVVDKTKAPAPSKPTQPTQKREKIQPIETISPRGLQSNLGEPTASVNMPIRPEARLAKHFDVKDVINAYGGGESSYQTENPADLKELGPGNTRTITPVYQSGGWLDQYQDGGHIPGMMLKSDRPTVNPKPRPTDLEGKVNALLGYPHERGRYDSQYKLRKYPDMDPNDMAANIDNLRHPSASMYTVEGMKKLGLGTIPSVIGANVMGAAHEVSTLFGDDDDNRSLYAKLRESGEDVFNNAVGSVVGALPMSMDSKRNTLRYLSDYNLLPDGSMPRPGADVKDLYNRDEETKELIRPYQSGGNMPGSVGFSYARTGAPPSNGKYGKKTLASAQAGKIIDPKLAKEVARNNRKLETKAIFDEARYKEKKQREAKEWVGKSMQQAYKHPLMQPGLLTPEGALIASMQSGVQSGMDVSEGNYGQAAMHAGFAALPFAGKIPGASKLVSKLAPEAEAGPPRYNPNEGINLSNRVRTAKPVQPPKWEHTDIGGGLTESTPIERGRMGSDADVIKRVSIGEEGRIDLRSYVDDNGETFHYFSANVPKGGIAAGKAFKHLEQYVPKGGKILEKTSLSTDSFHNVLQRAKDPTKFTASHEGYVPLNSAGVNKPLSNADEMIQNSPFVKFTKADEAKKALDEINSRIKLKGIPKARLKTNETKIQLIGSDKIHTNTNYSIEVPNIGLTKMYREGGIIDDEMGQWAHPGEITRIPSNDITMQGVPYDVLGISDEGDTKLMKPGKNYKFKGTKVTEFPKGKNGEKLRQEQKGKVNLDNLTNFTNYNTPQPGGWLDQYD